MEQLELRVLFLLGDLSMAKHMLDWKPSPYSKIRNDLFAPNKRIMFQSRYCGRKEKSQSEV